MVLVLIGSISLFKAMFKQFNEHPDIVEERHHLSKIKVDLIVGKGHKSALLVLVDRLR